MPELQHGRNGQGTVPMARQRGRLTILVYQISAMVCSSFEFYILEEPVKVRIKEVVNDCEKPSAEVVIW